MNDFKKIGHICMDLGLLTEEEVNIVLKEQLRRYSLFGQIALKMRFIREQDLVAVLSDIYNVPIIDLNFLCIDAPPQMMIPYDISIAHECVVFEIDAEIIKIAIADPGDIKTIDILYRYFFGKKLEFFIACSSKIVRLVEIIKKISQTGDYQDNSLDVSSFFNDILFEAIEQRASDVHFEPHQEVLKIRIRIDGLLKTICTVNYDIWPRLKSRLKIIADLNIAEKRKPQSGHTRISIGGRLVDLRISTHPGIYGENFALRIFDSSAGLIKLRSLDFSDRDLRWLLEKIKRPNGIFLIVGPTGSGKTTTLYALLDEINTPDVNIMTLEDPVEYRIDGVKQLDLREEGVISFCDGVRSILRQDPDVLLIGEIRDEATAASALRAALTGRLVLATLHSSTPLDGLRRLIDLKLNPNEFIPLLIGVFSQRLLRKLSKNANGVYDGYSGRFPVTEYIEFSESKKEKFLFNKQLFVEDLDNTFEMSSAEAIKSNKTDLLEIKRVFGNVNLSI